MGTVIIVGAGKIAKAVAHDLLGQGHDVCIASNDSDGATKIALHADSKKLVTRRLDAKNKEACEKLFAKGDLVISCAPYYLNPGLLKACISTGCHFLDLGGNNDIVAQELSMNNQAEKAGILAVPDCGLAPGLVSLFTMKLFNTFDVTERVHLRVGGLPQKPEGPLNYSLVFSVEGLINEYIEPVVVLSEGKPKTLEPMSDLESITFPSPYGDLEAFTTSGGISTLPTTYKGKIQQLDYKTIRYCGHCEKINTLIELGLTKSTVDPGMKHSPREILEARLTKLLSTAQPDVILVDVIGVGKTNDRYRIINYQIIDTYDATNRLTAMMRMTAFPTTILAGLILDGTVAERGVKTQETFAPYDKILQGLVDRGIRIHEKDNLS